jgi:hypothetical protein
MATSFSGEGSWNTRREPPTLGKQLVNFITCGVYAIFIYFWFKLSIVYVNQRKEEEEY